MEKRTRNLVICALLAAAACAPAAPAPAPRGGRYLPLVASHLDPLLAEGLDRFGPRQTPLWMSNLDPATGAHRPGHAAARVYRQIGAPDGVTFYWDQPQISAAHLLSQVTGDDRYARAARDYTTAYLRCCVDANGLVLWGNHQFYDAVADSGGFSGGHHELQPMAPASDRLWAHDSTQTERLAGLGVQRLHGDGLFQGRPGTGLHEAVDGVGYLLPAVMYLETGKDTGDLSYLF